MFTTHFLEAFRHSTQIGVSPLTVVCLRADVSLECWEGVGPASSVDTTVAQGHLSRGKLVGSVDSVHMTCWHDGMLQWRGRKETLGTWRVVASVRRYITIANRVLQ